MLTAEQGTERALLSVPKAAAVLGLNKHTLARAVASGEVPCVVLNGRPWVARVVVDHILALASGQANGNDEVRLTVE